MRKSKTLLFLLLAIPVLLIAFVAILLTQNTRIVELRIENAQLRADIDDLRTQNAMYKKSYELTLDDIRQLSKSYGGQDRYDELANTLRQRELGLVLNGTNMTTRNFTIKDGVVLSEYTENGIIKTDCLADATIIDTINDQVLFIIDARGDAMLYIDANLIIALHDGTQEFTITLPPGAHVMDILHRGTAFALVNMTADAEPVPLEGVVADAGEGWAVFDCVDISSRRTLDVPGALRLRLQKL